MYNVEYFGVIDIPALTLTAFTLFFIGLIVYLRREDRREGYPIEDDVTGRREPAQGFLFVAQPKTFRLAGGGTVSKPDGSRDAFELKASRSSPVPGTPLQPTGDPMLAALGPGAYADRAKTPDLTDHGLAKIVPLRAAKTYFVEKNDPDPRGYTVLGRDGRVAGTVSDVWIDQGEYLARYVEVELTGGGRRVLLPLTMAVVRRGRKVVQTDAVLASQFADAPSTAAPDQVTRDEEERIAAYFGGGYLYATPNRAEPWL